MDHNQQLRVAAWTEEVCGHKSAYSLRERSLRVAEEAIELCQAAGVSSQDVFRCLEYVYERPPGTPTQEIAGVFVTALAAAAACSVDADLLVEREIDRMHLPLVMDRVRARQAEKRARFGGEP